MSCCADISHLNKVILYCKHIEYNIIFSNITCKACTLPCGRSENKVVDILATKLCKVCKNNCCTHTVSNNIHLFNTDFVFKVSNILIQSSCAIYGRYTPVITEVINIIFTELFCIYFCKYGKTCFFLLCIL